MSKTIIHEVLVHSPPVLCCYALASESNMATTFTASHGKLYLVEFMYLVFTCIPGELPQATHVFVVFVWHLLSANNSLALILINGKHWLPLLP